MQGRELGEKHYRERSGDVLRGPPSVQVKADLQHAQKGSNPG